MQFKLPELGEGVHEGELIKWRVKPNDVVKYDQPLCEVMTDKATIEIPSACQGQVAELHVKEGSIVHVGELMLTFQGAENQPTPLLQAPSPLIAPSPDQKVGTIPLTEKSCPSTHVLAAPSTRRMAREMGIALSQVTGTGPQGRILKEDLQKTSTLPQGQKEGSTRREERVPFRGLRKKISEKMCLSKEKAVHFTYVEEADATELVILRAAAKVKGAQQGIKVTYLPFVMKAMVAALRQYPILNSTLDEARNELIYKYDYNIGLSIQTDEGLTAPVIKNVAQYSILELAQKIQDVVERARSKKLTIEDFQGGTITLTNAGSIGGLFTTPIINFPEVAILGLNKIVKRPVVKRIANQEEILIRDWTYFSLSLDHRIIDGAIAAEFMKVFIQYIETPSLLLL